MSIRSLQRTALTSLSTTLDVLLHLLIPYPNLSSYIFPILTPDSPQPRRPQPRLVTRTRPAVLLIAHHRAVAINLHHRDCDTTSRKGSAMNRLKQAAGHTKDVANLPPKLLDMYSEFITKNAGAVGQVEGALRSLTYIIPGTSSALCQEYCK